jgi:hypothetical protein
MSISVLVKDGRAVGCTDNSNFHDCNWCENSDKCLATKARFITVIPREEDPLKRWTKDDWENRIRG